MALIFLHLRRLLFLSFLPHLFLIQRDPLVPFQFPVPCRFRGPLFRSSPHTERFPSIKESRDGALSP